MDPQLQHRLMIYAGFIPGGLALVVLLTGWYLHALRGSRADLEGVDGDDAGDGDGAYETDGVDGVDASPAPGVSAGPLWLLPLLLGLGVMGADYATNYGFSLWPDANTYRYPHAIGLIALLGMAEGLVRLPVLAALVLRVVAYAGAFWMLSEGFTDTVLGGSGNLVAYALLASLGGALVATGIEERARLEHARRPAPWIDALVWLIVLGVFMAVLKAHHFALGAMLPAGVIAVLVSAALVSAVFPALTLARGGHSVLVGLVMMLLTGAFVQVGTENLAGLLLLIPPALVLLVPLPDRSRANRLLTRGVMALAAGGVAVLLSVGPTTGFWPAGDDASPEDASLEDYYNTLE